jgi:Holliday junction resolvase
MSRRKGKTFERAVAKQMTEWLGFKVSPTPSSGAYGTREGWTSLSGDLMFAEDFPFYVELKNRETFKLEDLFSLSGHFWDWQATAWADAKKNGKRPMLICKRNHAEPFVFLDGADTVSYRLALNYINIRTCNVHGFPLWTLFKLNPKAEI